MRRNRLTRKQFITYYVKPYIKSGDRPFNRAAFNDQLDTLHREGMITDIQAAKWTHPKNDLFYSKEDRKYMKRYKSQ